MYMSALAKQVGLLVIAVVVLIFFLALLSGWSPLAMQHASTAVSQTSARIPPPAPALTASEMIAAQSPKGFQLLISYVNTGFEPKTTTVHAGDTVRFTNNSTEALWVASVGTGGSQIYPGTSTCGGSAFDSCGPLQPGQYWQLTFTKKGTWKFLNNLDKSNAGVITVQ